MYIGGVVDIGNKPGVPNRVYNVDTIAILRGLYASGDIVIEIPTGDVDGVNTVFVMQHMPKTIILVMDGVVITDFVLVGERIVFGAAPLAGSVIQAYYNLGVSEYTDDDMVREVPTGLVNGVNTTFTLSNQASVAIIVVDGVVVNDYTLVDGSLEFNTAPLTGVEIEAYYNIGATSPIIVTKLTDLTDVYSTPIDGQAPIWRAANNRFEFGATGGSMTYPSGSGIPIVVSGVSWGSTITNNSTNWNTAYGWGNHALGGYVTGTPWTGMGYLTTQTSHVDVVVDGDFTSQGIMLRGASSGVYSILTDNSANWNTAFGWGNHASGGYLTTETDPIWVIARGIIQEPTGLNPIPTISMTTSTLNITGNHTAWYRGTSFAKTTQTLNLGAFGDGVWFIFYNSSGVLTYQQNAWSLINDIPICIVYKNGANYRLFDERHGTVMSGATHEYLHRTRGTAFISGFNATFSNTSFDLSNGSYADEDLIFDITGANPYLLSVQYRDAGLLWNWTSLQSNWWRAGAGGRPQYDNAGTPTELTSSAFGVYYIVATNDTTSKLASIMGQNTYSTLIAARAATYSGLSFGTYPSPETKVLYKVIVNATPSSGTLAEVQDLRTNAQLAGSTPILTDHGSLGGLLDDDHTQYALLSGRTGNTLNIDVINEFTAAAGVTIDGVLLKDNKIDWSYISNAPSIDSIVLPGSPSVNSTAFGTKVTLYAGETLAFGNTVYIGTNGRAFLSDADAAATMHVVGIALGAATVGVALDILLHGVIRNDTWNWNAGEKLYASTTLGAITNIAPIGSGDIVQVLGSALTGDIVLFNPSPNTIVLS